MFVAKDTVQYLKEINLHTRLERFVRAAIKSRLPATGSLLDDFTGTIEGHDGPAPPDHLAQLSAIMKSCRDQEFLEAVHAALRSRDKGHPPPQAIRAAALQLSPAQRQFPAVCGQAMLTMGGGVSAPGILF